MSLKTRAIQTGRCVTSSGFGPPLKPSSADTLTTPIAAPPAATTGDPDIPARMASAASVIQSPRQVGLQTLQENHLPFRDISEAVLLSAGSAGENPRRRCRKPLTFSGSWHVATSVSY